MQVILLERIRALGQMGDVVNVKNGYARNFLLPQGKGAARDRSQCRSIRTARAQLETRNLDEKNEAAAVGERLNGQGFRRHSAGWRHRSALWLGFDPRHRRGHHQGRLQR